jgi:hypothetical protein
LDAQDFKVDQVVHVFELADLVLAEVQLLQVVKAGQVLNLPDPGVNVRITNFWQKN